MLVAGTPRSYINLENSRFAVILDIGLQNHLTGKHSRLGGQNMLINDDRKEYASMHQNSQTCSDCFVENFKAFCRDYDIPTKISKFGSVASIYKDIPEIR